jgi:circadian clock protein KaiB
MNRDYKTEDREPAPNPQGLWRLRLYVNGRTSLKTIVALRNIKELCEKHLAAGYELEVVDLVENFAHAREDNVIALPTLVRRSPLPVRKIIGELSNTDQVMTALGLPSAEPNGSDR